MKNATKAVVDGKLSPMTKGANSVNGTQVTLAAMAAVIMPPQLAVAVKAEQTRLQSFLALVKGHPVDDVKHVFRSASKEQKAAGKPLAPLVYEIIASRKVSESVAKVRVSEAHTLFRAYLAGYQPKAGTVYAEAVQTARDVLKDKREADKAHKVDAEIGTTFAAMKKTAPEGTDLMDLFSAAEKLVREESEKDEQNAKLGRLEKQAEKAGLQVIPATETPDEQVYRILAQYGENGLLAVVKAGNKILAKMEGQRNAAKAAETEKAKGRKAAIANERQENVVEAFQEVKAEIKDFAEANGLVKVG